VRPSLKGRNAIPFIDFKPTSLGRFIYTKKKAEGKAFTTTEQGKNGIR
jgi:hypothetical protein